MTEFFAALAAACKAYVAWVQWQRETQVDTIEDEMDHLAVDGSAAAKLRLERLNIRRKRKLESLGVV